MGKPPVQGRHSQYGKGSCNQGSASTDKACANQANTESRASFNQGTFYMVQQVLIKVQQVLIKEQTVRLTKLHLKQVLIKYA